ncbi:MAG: hypothetical protein A2Y56_02090 [Candidatus Aminicenantes bacterium RBG_13_63_10]|nr:MAG: hypothetical protein A2Y56_02090 [Candidatus Aminicenantes bacterium RBG_13_63_10]
MGDTVESMKDAKDEHAAEPSIDGIGRGGQLPELADDSLGDAVDVGQNELLLPRNIGRLFPGGYRPVSKAAWLEPGGERTTDRQGLEPRHAGPAYETMMMASPATASNLHTS